jgi:regulator of sigma E protease
MPKSEASRRLSFRGLCWLAIFAVVLYLIVRHINTFGNVLVMLIGFGAVVLVHEFGHFIVAKLSDINVEAFSIFMPPIFLGVRKTEQGYRFRLLPKLVNKNDGQEDESLLSFTIGKRGKPGETEYRIGLIPFGGFVKLLGQEDTGPTKSTDDPRSFANKPVHTRIFVIAAGVLFNVLSAVIFFMIVFLVGIKLPPAVVGGVVPGSPAAQVGLKPGDKVVEIAGKSKDLDFSNIMLAAALSGPDEKVPLTVRHEDGSEESFHLTAERMQGQPMRDFGIVPPMSLTVAEVTDINSLRKETGLLPGDHIKAVNGKPVDRYWELAEVIGNTIAPEATLEVERANETVATTVELVLPYAETDVESEEDLNHICSMVPRLKVIAVADDESSSVQESDSPLRTIKNRFASWFREESKKKGGDQNDLDLEVGDIVLKVGDRAYPTYAELREITIDYEDKELPVEVLRAAQDGSEKIETVSVVPRRSPSSDRVVIGIYVALDAQHPVVAKSIDAKGGPARLDIPRGAIITAVNDREVASFYDIIEQIRQVPDQTVKIDYRLDEQTAGSVVVRTTGHKNLIRVKPTLAEYIPFKRLEKLYRADGPIETVTMGYRRTVTFVAQAYVTLKRVVGGVVSPKHLMGPVGIMAFSYRIVAEKPLVDYVYLLGLISAVIAVFNILPLPPLDGGLIVLMLVEKVKGSAISERVQGVIVYAGWILIGTLLLYVTFNDIVRNFLGQ